MNASSSAPIRWDRLEVELSTAGFQALVEDCVAVGIDWQRWAEVPALRDRTVLAVCARMVREREARGLSRHAACAEVGSYLGLAGRRIEAMLQRADALRATRKNGAFQVVSST